MIQVYNKDKGTETFDVKKEEETLSRMSTANARQCVYELRDKGNIEDERYLFF